MNVGTVEHQHEILNISGPAAERFDSALADGGVPPAVGVQSFQVFRASRDVPQQTDGVGWTYHHHVDMASWKGRLYVGWNSCERDEDVWPSRELFSTSIDGRAWTAPAELFPQGISTPLRIYFYRSSNDRMLAIAGRRVDEADTDEDKKGALVVREIFADHTLGDVFTLQSAAPGSNATIVPANAPAMYDQSSSIEFKNACAQLLADRMFLEQQDRGKLLGDRRMKWHDASAWASGIVPGDNQKWVSGKAFSFFQRPDGAYVGVSKMGWTTYSHDDGQTWSEPAVPPTLVTGKAKVWSQRTADGRFALVYNPSRSNRYPLVAIASEDGVNFRDMCLIQGELPIQRYAGLHRSIGPQYVRGISHWANDGSRSENVMWLVYSMNKEDIWVSRVPLPLACDVEARSSKPLWNLYSPKWSSIREEDGVLEMSQSDPYDYAQATHVFPESSGVTVDFELSVDEAERAHLEIDLLTKFGSHRPVRVLVSRTSSKLSIKSGEVASFHLTADAARQTYSLTINCEPVIQDECFSEPADRLHRVAFRTGPHRGIGGLRPVLSGTDRPLAPVVYRLGKLSVQTSE